MTTIDDVRELINSGTLSLFPGQAVGINPEYSLIANGRTVSCEEDNLIILTIAASRRSTSIWTYAGANVVVDKTKITRLKISITDKESDDNKMFVIHLFEEKDVVAKLTPITPDHVSELIYKWHHNKEALTSYDKAAMINIGILFVNKEGELKFSRDFESIRDSKDELFMLQDHEELIVDSGDDDKYFDYTDFDMDED